MKPTVIQKPAAIGNYAIGRTRAISRVTFHHIVGDAAGAISKFQTAGIQVSAHYVIGSDGTIYQCVGEANTAWCDGSADSNARTISIEHAGGSSSVVYTEAMYASSIKLVRHLIATYGIKDFQRHRDVVDKAAYPGGTACPGTLDVERIVKAAQGGDMAYLPDEELNDLRVWKEKGLNYENVVVPAMDVDKQAWMKRALDAEARLGQATDKVVSRAEALAYIEKNLK